MEPPWTLTPLPDFLVRSLARQRKKATTLYEIQVYPPSMDDDPKCVPVVTPPHPHDQLPPYEIRLIAKPSAYKHSPLPPDLGSCPFSSHQSTTSHPHKAF